MIAGVILAGGRSSRMGGGDKPLQQLDREPVLAWIVRRLERQVEKLAINANGDPARFAIFRLPVIADTVDGFQGPLAGIVAAMEWARSEGAADVLTVAGDTPFFPDDLARVLGAARQSVDHIAVAASAGRLHPTFAIWPVPLITELQAFLATGASRSVMTFLDRHPYAVADFEMSDAAGTPIDPFFNINTPDDLAEARRIAEKLRA